MKTEFKKVRRKRYKWGGGEESADLYKRSKWLIDCDSSHSWGEVMKRRNIDDYTDRSFDNYSSKFVW